MAGGRSGDGGLSEKPRVLCVSDASGSCNQLQEQLRRSCEVVEVRGPLRALATLAKHPFEGVYVAAGHLREALRIGKLLENERVLDGMPDGVVVIDPDNVILWANAQFLRWVGREVVTGEVFYSVLGNPEI